PTRPGARDHRQGRGAVRVQLRVRRRPDAARHLGHTSRTSSAAPPDSGNTSVHVTWGKRCSRDRLSARPHMVWFVPGYHACASPAGFAMPRSSCHAPEAATDGSFRTRMGPRYPGCGSRCRFGSVPPGRAHRMTQRRSPLYDSAPALLARGYAWLPGLRRRAGGDVTTRLLGKRAVGLRGPEAVRFFYDERHVTRAGVVPEPIKGTLFGKGGVHGLDGQAHRTRKAMFLTVLADPDSVARLIGRVGEAWEARAATWPGRERVVLFDEAAAVIAEGVCAWAGVPVDDPEGIAADMVAMVDGFATLGPRHWRARRARG